jgi:hypothetical protein
MIGPDPNYQPPQYDASTRRKGQRLHGYITNHSGDWKPAQVSNAYCNGIELENGKTGYDQIEWD